MKERPIIFICEMVRAILDGRKTQTRRVVTVPYVNGKRCAPWAPYYTIEDGVLYCEDKYGDYHKAMDSLNCPYGYPGDRLWVKEMWADNIAGCNGGISYRADHADPQGDGPANPIKWRPSIYMPRWASRINILVKDVRIERVQDITEEDARREGVTGNPYYMADGKVDEAMSINARDNFSFLWDSGTQSTRGAASDGDTNPWVWVVDFERI